MKLYVRPLHNTKALKVEEPSLNQIDLYDKIIKWGDDDNNMPYIITTTVQRSVTGRACSNTYLQYLYGNGFNDKDVARALDACLYNVAAQYLTYRAFALKVYLNAFDLKIAKVEPIALEHLRLTIPDKNNEVHTVKYNAFFGSTTDYRQYKSKTYPLWDESVEKLRERAIKYPNTPFIMWYSDFEAFSNPYPLPDFWGDNSTQGGGYEAMIADYALGKLLTKELFDGFMQNVLLKMVGNPDEPITKHAGLAEEGKDYTTKGQEFERELDRNFKGLDGASMMIVWSLIKEQFPEVQAFPSSFNYDKLNNVVETVRTQVATVWNVPSILANIATSGTLSKDDITSAVRLMWGVVRRKQLTLERYFQIIVNDLAQTTKPELLGKVANIENYSPFPIQDEISDKVWSELSPDERRGWINKNTNIELNQGQTTSDSSATNESENPAQALAQAQLRGSVGGVQGILAIADNYKNGIVSAGAATTILVEIYGFSEEIAGKILGVDALTQTSTAQANEPTNNDVLTNLTGRQLQGIQRIVRKYNQGQLTYEQAAILLKSGFGFNDIEAGLWLTTPEEE